jgi:hypothetical protein
MCGKVILGAVIVVLVAVWGLALWLYFIDPRVLLPTLQM